MSGRRILIKTKYFWKLWHHLHEKLNLRDKTRRVKYFPCAIELIQKSRLDPTSKENPEKRSEIFHRFAGSTKENDLFFVQIRENKRTGQKWFMSVFPAEKLR